MSLPPGGSRRDVDDEVAFHLACRVRRLVAEGMSPEEAEAEARRRFGDVEAVKAEMMRLARNREGGMMGMGARVERIGQDLRYGTRQLLARPVFTLVAVATLALGIGANTAVFSVVDGILFRPLPYEEPAELVAVWLDVTERGGPGDEWPNYPDVHDLGEAARSLEAVAFWDAGMMTLTGRGEPELLRGAFVSRAMFDRVVPVEPVLGRLFAEEEDRPGAPPTVLLAHGLWRRAFAGDPDVVGKTVTLQGEAVTVVGVLPRGFRPPFARDAELWMPLRWSSTDNGCGRGGYCIHALARMADGASLDDARREADVVARRLAEAYPDTNAGERFLLRPLRDDLVGPARRGLLVLLGAAGLVLLLACVNVAGLLLTRGGARRGELAVRAALGAGRGRLVSQLLAESLLLAAAGGLAGAGLGWLLTDALVALAPPDTPRLDEVALNGGVLGVAGVTALVAAALFGVMPALKAGAAEPAEALGEGGGRSGRRRGSARASLVVAQVALAVVLLVGAGLLGRTWQNLRHLDMGYRPEGLLTLRLTLPQARYPDGDGLRAFYGELDGELGAVPGVTAVGGTSSLPLVGFDSDVSFGIENRPPPPPGTNRAVWFRRVTPGYLQAMGTPLARGRGILASDGPRAPRVVVINETFARRWFPDEDPLGKRINLGSPDDPDWREIVGVARDVRHFGLRGEPRDALYLPFAQAPTRTVFLVIRSDREVAGLARDIRRVLGRADPLLAGGPLRPMTDVVRGVLGPERLLATLLGGFGALASSLALVGLYGIVAYQVTLRRAEMGLRMALGARARMVAALVVGESLRLVVLGIVLGAGAAVALARLVGSLLYGVDALDPVTFFAVGALLAACGVAAALVPAVRAARVDPSRVLGAE